MFNQLPNCLPLFEPKVSTVSYRPVSDQQKQSGQSDWLMDVEREQLRILESINQSINPLVFELFASCKVESITLTLIRQMGDFMIVHDRDCLKIIKMEASIYYII
jgi:hypothetical protein